MRWARSGVIPVITAKTAVNLNESTLFGKKGLRVKYCTNKTCWTLQPQVYSNFYRQSGLQNLPAEHIQAKDLEGFCKICFDERKRTRHSRLNKQPTSTLSNFLCEGN